MVKAIFFDIDGTLVAMGQKGMSSLMIQTLHDLRAKGIKLFIATGRQSYLLDIVTKDFKFDGYVTLNGSICYDQDFHCIYHQPLHKEDQQKMIQLFDDHAYSLVMVEQNDNYINYLNDMAKETYEMLHIKIPRFDCNHGNDIYQLIAYIDEVDEQHLMNQLPHCKAVRWNALGIDILPKNSGKIIGTQETLNHFKIDVNECIAFGDGENDIDMLQLVGVGVAMDNAHPNVKAIADDFCFSVDDDGIYHYLKAKQII